MKQFHVRSFYTDEVIKAGSLKDALVRCVQLEAKHTEVGVRRAEMMRISAVEVGR